MHCNNLRLVLGLGLVRVSSRVRARVRVKVRVSVLVRVSIRTNWVMNFAVPASNLHSSHTRKHPRTARSVDYNVRQSERGGETCVEKEYRRL